MRHAYKLIRCRMPSCTDVALKTDSAYDTIQTDNETVLVLYTCRIDCRIGYLVENKLLYVVAATIRQEKHPTRRPYAAISATQGSSFVNFSANSKFRVAPLSGTSSTGTK